MTRGSDFGIRARLRSSAWPDERSALGAAERQKFVLLDGRHEETERPRSSLDDVCDRWL
jgi:hypothetical protein